MRSMDTRHKESTGVLGETNLGARDVIMLLTMVHNFRLRNFWKSPFSIFGLRLTVSNRNSG